VRGNLLLLFKKLGDLLRDLVSFLVHPRETVPHDSILHTHLLNDLLVGIFVSLLEFDEHVTDFEHSVVPAVAVILVFGRDDVQEPIFVKVRVDPQQLHEIGVKHSALA
jgi:hypothetical protein